MIFNSRPVKHMKTGAKVQNRLFLAWRTVVFSLTLSLTATSALAAYPATRLDSC